MDNRSILSPGCVTARYTPQRMPQFKGNPLVEALPPLLDNEELVKALTLRPDFDPEQREWSSRERIVMLGTLKNFMIPMAKHISGADSLDMMLRTSYIGRVPQTPEHARLVQERYENQKNNRSVVQSANSCNPQVSALLMGTPGMGKTSFVKRWRAQMPQVIYHPDLHRYQVTYLHVELPSAGASSKALATSLLQQLDELIPGANYYKTYGLKGSPGGDTMLGSLTYVLAMHSVGILFVDEIQNLANSKKEDQTLMTELVTLCNTLKCAILFIGTNKAAKLFSLDFRQARRTCGNGFDGWDRLLQASAPGDIDEWRDFLDVLWAYQWVRQPIELNELYVQLMYDISQGVIDIAIQVFVGAQKSAIEDGSEVITPELIIKEFGKKGFDKVRPMLGALRDKDFERQVQYEDIACVDIGQTLETLTGRLKGKRAGSFSVKPGDLTFVSRVASSLVAAGIEEVDALEVAAQVAREGKVQNLISGTEAALKLLKSLKPATSAKSGPEEPRQMTSNASKAGTKVNGKPVMKQVAPEPAYAEDDYRSAIARAGKERTTIYAQLQAMGAARPLEDLLELT